MKTQHLHDIWASPDNSRLTPKQFSFRLPVHIAAKIAALCELYPQKNRTQIVADLLTAALDDLESNLPMALGAKFDFGGQAMTREMAKDFGDGEVFEMSGVRSSFRDLANKHYLELEKELGNDKPIPLFPTLLITEKDAKESQSK